MDLPTLTIGGAPVPLRLPPFSARQALLSVFLKYQENDFVRLHLECAALGLCVSDQAPPVWRRGLAESEWDLVRYGREYAEMAEVSATTAAEWLDIASAGSMCAIAIFASLAPSKAEVKRARDFSEKPAGRKPASRSRKPTKEARSAGSI